MKFTFNRIAVAHGAFALLFSTGAWGQCDPGTLPVDYSIGGGSYVSEISWQLNDADGNNLLSGVAEEASGQICLAEGTYTFSGTDSYGDGWNGNVANFSLFGNLIGSYVMDEYDCFYAGDGSYPAPGCTTSITFDVSNEVPGCTDPSYLEYDFLASIDNGSCATLLDPGCTIPIACNYNPAANVDDGSCDFFCPGCTDEEACNFDAEALQDDGSCFYPESEEFCDCDGSQVDALGECGGSCEADADSDGVCDDIDPCVGNFDECDICNGPGPIYECGCTSISAGNCDCEGNQLDALGTCGGNCQSDADADGICDDIDDCVGEYDECGVCGGNGISEGACNCAGELLDDCGVCGGDNTSCLGCTYELACNYDPEAILLDATLCEFGTCGGCTVIGACNYNPTLNIDDGSCEWCGCLEESSVSDAGGVWEGDGTYFLSIEAYPATAVPGATTYRFYVNFDDANDQMSAVFGNNEFPLEVNVPEGAFNSEYNSSWNASGINPAFLAVFPELVDDTFATLGLEGPASTSGIAGAANPQIAEDAGQPITPFFLTDGADQLLSNSVIGASWFTINTSQNAYAGDDLRTLVMQITTTGGISGTLTYQVYNQFEPSTSVDAVQISSSFDVDFSQGIGGCTDTEAANYCPQAMFDDGSCLDSYVGCWDEEACNYSATATTDVGAECIYPQGAECDCDGNVLDECGVCGGGGIPEGTCDCEGNGLDECGVCGGSGIPEGQCDCDGNIPDECGVCGGDGIPEGDCDCDGNVLDECGECGGQGIAEGTCDCDGNMLDALGVCGGDCLIDQNNNGICDIDELGVGSCGPESCGPGTVWDPETQACIVAYPADTNFDGCVQLNDLLDLLAAYGLCQTTATSWSCGDPMTYQGYDYATVLIGDQCWFAENLRNENYENGDVIPSNLSDSEWSNYLTDPSWNSTIEGASAVYGEDAGCNDLSPDIDACNPAQSLSEYGRLYNWFAVDDARGLCPSGWHVPSDGEWTTMTDFLGGESVAGSKMKTTYGWLASGTNGNGTNSSGFSGLPGGERYYGGQFFNAGGMGYWWSSSHSFGYLSWYRNLNRNTEAVHRTDSYKQSGFSVRCVRDAE